jgi:hypothetical protein
LTTICTPYVPGLSERIKKICTKVNIRTVFSSKNTLKSRLVNTKPKSLETYKKDVIYSIPCECGLNYIGETSRPLEVRVREHQRRVEQRDPGSSKLADHALEERHNITWDDAKVIGRETQWKKRQIHEAAEMAKLNYKTISQSSFDLDKIWNPLLRMSKLKNMKSSASSTLPNNNQVLAAVIPLKRSARLATAAVRKQQTRQ